MSKMLKQLIQDTNEDQKYKQVLEALNESLAFDGPLSCETPAEHKDFAIFITNLLIFNFEKVDNSYALIAGLRKLTERMINTSDSPSLISELINELENKFLDSKLLTSRENILYFLSEINWINSKSQFMKKSHIVRVFEFFKTSFSFTHQTRNQHFFTLRGLLKVCPLADMDPYSVTTILSNIKKLSSENNNDLFMNELIAKVAWSLVVETRRINNKTIMAELERFILTVF